MHTYVCVTCGITCMSPTFPVDTLRLLHKCKGSPAPVEEFGKFTTSEGG